ncbi:zf-HC2 domain-containing protein [Rhodococcus sp. H36-A4]|uniref:zf-HC2 domain-containing protein n=1 Tax=unclassified Rhodococcus (in: high G+C Gram-positive bacteria) TaxID=192944 RepID=UPI00109DBE3A|nr:MULTISPECIES: zf-HC2 domain-containing protein [unclassified Rhodococcus (in: high G+C Gram-positive bacteria)]MCZ4077716.1 zf-HC2 domain-containing protein [Rhodococcus sp. H36-A4]MDJ0359420.1 zf-HC2 domain-containing protein [Rhodococcus sp. H29-C3]QCB49287.1 zf-HC2 domain-containing protein [Rhodococcus sp. PAMC28705]QCB59025.1 zf-HC2 domain-containing protein [Rhodococcus sp. PAMC28707]
MMKTARMMLTCHWSARRLQRYLDADPSGRLDPTEVRRIEAHLAVCARCRAAEGEFRQIDTALSRWTVRTVPDEKSVEHARKFVDRLTRGDMT